MNKKCNNCFNIIDSAEYAYCPFCGKSISDAPHGTCGFCDTPLTIKSGREICPSCSDAQRYAEEYIWGNEDYHYETCGPLSYEHHREWQEYDGGG